MVKTLGQSRSCSSSSASTIPRRGAEADSHGPCDHGDSTVQDCLRIQHSAWFDNGYMHCVSLWSFSRSRRTRGGDEDAWDVRVRFVGRGDVEGGQGPNAISKPDARVRGTTFSAAMPPLEAQRHCVKNAQLKAKCEEEEWAELPDEFKKFGNHAKLKSWLYGMRKKASR